MVSDRKDQEGQDRWNEFFYHVLTEQDGGEVAEFIGKTRARSTTASGFIIME
jgi:hypothetical protein